MPVERIQLGKSDLRVSRLGLGCMGMSEYYGVPDDPESMRTLEAALECGVNFFDTADAYGRGQNEILLSKFIQAHPGRLVIATKGGIDRKDHFHSRYINNQSAFLRSAVESSLRRLRLSSIDLYYIHRVDPLVPIEESVGALARLVEKGDIRAIGLSEANAENLERACKVHPIAALQTEYSLWSRDPESELVPLCERLGVTFVAYSPLGKGMLSGGIRSRDEIAEADARSKMPRFQEGNFERNLSLIRKMEELASRAACTPAQLALAWLLARQPKMAAIPGTKKVRYLRENMQSCELRLSQEILLELERVFSADTIHGERYSAAALKAIAEQGTH